MQTKRNTFILGAMLTVLLLMITMTSVTAAENVKLDAVTNNVDTNWTIYTDPRFDLSMEYPSTWVVIPREDEPGYVGATFAFVDGTADNRSESCATSPIRIEVGLYLVEFDETALTLAEWSEQYDKNANEELFPSDAVRVADASEITINGSEGYRKEAVSPLTAFSYVNIPHGRTVWFIWMNSMSGEYADIFDHVVHSVKFGKDTPNSLKEAYGQNFSPLPLEKEEKFDSFSDGPSEWLVPMAAPSGYRVPFDGPSQRSIKCGHLNSSLCNGTHKNSAAKAIDISASVGTSVKNSVASYTYWTGWNSSGYGNLVIMRDPNNGNRIYYAHLSQFNVANLYPGGIPGPWPEPLIAKGLELALSGQSGSPGIAAHLHFHVQTSSGGAVDLAGMPNLTLYSGSTNGYPHCGKTTCPPIPPGFECTCGRLY